MTVTDYSTCDLPILESRVDWLTCTAKHDARGVDLQTYADRHMARQVLAGEKAEAWRFSGYSGFHGGNWSYGWGREGAIVVVTQDEANRHAATLAQLADHWSRVDYCVTALDEAGAMVPDVDYWREIHRTYDRQSCPVKVTRRQEAWGGATITFGDRQSAYMTRVYNKHAESKGDYPAGSWRWELEMKRHASEGQHMRWRERRLDPDTMAATIARELHRVQLEVPWKHPVAPRRDPQVHQTSTLDKKIAWLERCVRGPVQEACAAGGYERVLRALNLPHSNF